MSEKLAEKIAMITGRQQRDRARHDDIPLWGPLVDEKALAIRYRRFAVDYRDDGSSWPGHSFFLAHASPQR
jgi:hypothetical protein